MIKNLYETVFVLHPEMTDEEAEAGIQNTVQLLEDKGAEIIRVDRGGKRRLAYVIRKQRYGYYTLVHFRATPEPLLELERMYRLNERVLRYLTVRFEKEEHLMGFTRVPDDDGREDDRDDRRRGGRRGDFRGDGGFHGRGESRYPRRGMSDDGPMHGDGPRFGGDGGLDDNDDDND